MCKRCGDMHIQRVCCLIEKSRKVLVGEIPRNANAIGKPIANGDIEQKIFVMHYQKWWWTFCGVCGGFVCVCAS